MPALFRPFLFCRKMHTAFLAAAHDLVVGFSIRHKSCPELSITILT